ncbi:MAG: helix-turn-helix domain-containing protein [Acidobacteria bacterium]|nr:helix-turn-helix domain-containing protein [Acidobacteriota bacterium]
MTSKRDRQQTQAQIEQALGIVAALLAAPPEAETVSPSAFLMTRPELRHAIRRKARREARRIVHARLPRRLTVRLDRRTAPRRIGGRQPHRSRAASSGGSPGDDGPSSADPPLALPVAAALLIVFAALLVGGFLGAGAALALPAFGFAAGGLLTEREAAEALRLSTRTLRRLRAEGLLGFVQFGRRILYREADVAALPAQFYIPPKGGAR